MEKAPYYGNLEKTALLAQHFEVPQSERDGQWKATLFENVAEASFACGNPQLFYGPDGFPYFELNLPEPNQPFQCYVIKHIIEDFLLEKGFGVVIHPGKENPDWVFSYGDMLNFHLNKEFYSPSKASNLPETEILEKEEQVLVSAPGEHILPSQTRAIMRDYLSRMGITGVKVLLMIRNKPEGEIRELVFNLTPEKFASDADYIMVHRTISWFLPRHYTHISMNDSSMGENFAPL